MAQASAGPNLEDYLHVLSDGYDYDASPSAVLRGGLILQVARTRRRKVYLPQRGIRELAPPEQDIVVCQAKISQDRLSVKAPCKQHRKTILYRSPLHSLSSISCTEVLTDHGCWQA